MNIIYTYTSYEYRYIILDFVICDRCFEHAPIVTEARSPLQDFYAVAVLVWDAIWGRFTQWCCSASQRRLSCAKYIVRCWVRCGIECLNSIDYIVQHYQSSEYMVEVVRIRRSSLRSRLQSTEHPSEAPITKPPIKQAINHANMPTCKMPRDHSMHPSMTESKQSNYRSNSPIRDQ